MKDTEEIKLPLPKTELNNNMNEPYYFMGAADQLVGSNCNVTPNYH